MTRKRKQPSDSSKNNVDVSRYPLEYPTAKKLRLAKTASTSHPVLSAHYPQVLTLRNYILSKIPETSKIRRRKISAIRALSNNQSQDFNCEIAQLLDTTLIGILKDAGPEVTVRRQKDLIAYTQAQNASRAAAGTLNSSALTCPIDDVRLLSIVLLEMLTDGIRSSTTQSTRCIIAPSPA